MSVATVCAPPAKPSPEKANPNPKRRRRVTKRDRKRAPNPAVLEKLTEPPTGIGAKHLDPVRTSKNRKHLLQDVARKFLEVKIIYLLFASGAGTVESSLLIATSIVRFI
jgi:hypothetical protein